MSPASISLERAILEALAYSDIFGHPLRFDELHRYLPTRAGMEDLSSALTSLNGQIGKRGEYFFLARREEIVEIRKQRLARSKNLLPHALRYGRILGALPFIRMVALTGSLAVLNISKNADFDYMLVAAKGRVWTARAFALALNRLARLFGHTICPNLIVSESALEWPLHDLYSARELAQMIPIAGMDAYRRVMEVNAWARELLPNRSHDFSREYKATKVATTFQPFTEFLLRGNLGDKLERWEMTRKIARFSNQPGFGEETVFTAEVCQGNFHHHRKWTREIFEHKLSALEKEVTVTFKVTVT
ncbi:MAG: hypothetical protein IT313_12905 [Anaerolineales bacterium]|nr:hypothetical protein [Anaerolineales bacterium]